MQKIHDAVLAYCKSHNEIRGIYATSDGEFILKCGDIEAALHSGMKYVFKLDGSRLILV
jgi:hypothetical protein